MTKRYPVENINEVVSNGTIEGRVVKAGNKYAIEVRSDKCRNWSIDSYHATACDACEVLESILEFFDFGE